jgi:hypothetical protein
MSEPDRLPTFKEIGDITPPGRAPYLRAARALQLGAGRNEWERQNRLLSTRVLRICLHDLAAGVRADTLEPPLPLSAKLGRYIVTFSDYLRAEEAKVDARHGNQELAGAAALVENSTRGKAEELVLLAVEHSGLPFPGYTS